MLNIIGNMRLELHLHAQLELPWHPPVGLFGDSRVRIFSKKVSTVTPPSQNFVTARLSSRRR